MKKNLKILIIAAIAAVLLLGLMLVLIFAPKGEGSNGAASFDEGVAMSVSTDKNGVHQAKIKTNEKGEIENNSYGTLISYVPADISKIHIENGKGTLDITSYTPKNEKGETDATKYTIEGFEDFDLQPGIADEIASNAASLEFSKVMTLDKNKAGDYGLEKPRTTATITYNDKTKSIVYVGNDAPQGAGTYVKFGDGDEVYLVSADAVSAFEYGLTDLMSLTINDSAADNDNSQASSIVISGSNFPKAIELKPNSGEKVSASYVMTSPVECYANENESSLVDGAIRGLYAESVKMVNPSDSQLGDLGLKNSYARIKAVYPDVTVDIIASKPDGEGKVCLMKNGGNVVYVMTSEKLPWVVTSYEKLVSEYVLYPKMSSLSSVSVNDGNKTYDFNLATKKVTSKDSDGSDTTSSTTTVKCGNKELNLDYFSTFYQNMAMMEFADVKSASASGTPVFTVKYTYSSDGTSDTVAFYSAGDNKYIASVNGTSMGHVYQSKVKSLINQAGQIAQNKEVESLL